MFFDVSEDLVVGALTFPAGREESGLRLLPAAVTRLCWYPNEFLRQWAARGYKNE